jgi:transposase
LRQKVRRCQLPALLAQTPPCSIVMEACSSSHYWAREARSHGPKVRLIAPQHVKAFTRGQKNDRNDAEAIAVAAGQPGIPDVAVKSEEQQAILALHRIRARLVKER